MISTCIFYSNEINSIQIDRMEAFLPKDLTPSITY